MLSTNSNFREIEELNLHWDERERTTVRHVHLRWLLKKAGKAAADSQRGCHCLHSEVIPLMELKQEFCKRSRPPWQLAHFSYENWTSNNESFIKQIFIAEKSFWNKIFLKCHFRNILKHKFLSTMKNLFNKTFIIWRSIFIRKVGELSWWTRSLAESLL